MSRRIIYEYSFGQEQLNHGAWLVFNSAVEAKLLAVQMQGEQLCFWMEIDLDDQDSNKEHAYWVCGTCWRIPDCRVGSHVATVQERSYVWHIYAEVAGE